MPFYYIWHERRKIMPVTDSPLRYPGGKTKIYDRVKVIIDENMDDG